MDFNTEVIQAPDIFLSLIIMAQEGMAFRLFELLSWGQIAS